MNENNKTRKSNKSLRVLIHVSPNFGTHANTAPVLIR